MRIYVTKIIIIIIKINVNVRTPNQVQWSQTYADFALSRTVYSL